MAFHSGNTYTEEVDEVFKPVRVPIWNIDNYQ